jgi:hypothetical protein
MSHMVKVKDGDSEVHMDMVMSPAGLGPENDCAAEDQQQF